MRETPALIQEEVLTYQQDDSTVEVLVGSAPWYAWLETASTFTVHSGQGHFTARKERAGNQRGAPYWRAYQKRGGKLYRAYLGQSEDLTLARLQAVAVVLASKGAGEDALDTPDLGAGTSSAALAPSRAHAQQRRATGAPKPHEAALPTPWLSSLPMPLSALIGREPEVQAIGDLLAQPEVRLLTITGTGGVGKTRLALEVARVVRANFADGTCFVPLAPVSDPTRVLAAIAQALGLWEVADLPPQEQVQAALRERQLLLLLDNFEQVVQAAPQLASLLAACPRLRMLVTSRAVLHLSGEYEFPVAPLALPDLTQPLSSELLAQSASVRLFVQRAQAIQPAFDVTPANARTLAEICVQLDGLPLAIELAAGRSKLLPPQALLARLAHRLEVLTGGALDLPARQQTLRNTLEWSYDLLSQEEQRLFRWLSVFVGGCTLEAAEAVCQASGEQAPSVLDGVASLLDKSLVQQAEREGGEPRLVLLETLREFGLGYLAREGELEAARRAHAHSYRDLAEQAEPELEGPKQATWLARLEHERDNLRAALEWALEEAPEQVAERKELALRLSGSLQLHWQRHGRYREASTFLERALASSEGERTSVRAKALRTAAVFALFRGDHTRAEMLAKLSLALCRELEDTRGIVLSLDMLGSVLWPKGKTTEKISLQEELVRFMRQRGQPPELADALTNLAGELSLHGEYARGHALLEEALALFRQAGNEHWVGMTLVQSAQFLWFSLGDAATIRQRLREGQALIDKVGDRRWRASSIGFAAQLALEEGELDRAASLIKESLAISREIDFRWYIAVALAILGRVEAQQGNLSAAYSSYQESLALAENPGEEWFTAFKLEGLARVVAAQGASRWAAQLWGAAEALREALAVPLPPVYHADYEQAVRRARTQLGAPAFAAALQEGRAMTPEQVLAAHGQVTISSPRQRGARSPLPTKIAPSFPSVLTAREVEVLRLVAQGMTDALIADHLVISPRTVNWHLTTIYSKLQVSSRAAATRYALEHQLV